jgi:acetyltransferase-like isoleucine patch superfamily enzyme
LTIGNGVFIGHGVRILVCREVIVEDGAGISAGCFIADTDGHPASLEERIQGLPAPPQEILSVRIGRNAWIGRGSYIMKGVTVGEGAVVGVGSVVLNDVPPFATVVGAPSRLIRVSPPSGQAGSELPPNANSDATARNRRT